MGGWIGFYYGIAIETVSLIKNPFILSMFSMSTYEFILSWFLPILLVLLRGIRGRGPQLHCGSPETWGVGFLTIFKYLQPVPHSCQHWHKHAKRVPETSRSRKWSCITKYEQPPFASIGEAKELIPTTSSTFLKHEKHRFFKSRKATVPSPRPQEQHPRHIFQSLPGSRFPVPNLMALLG